MTRLVFSLQLPPSPLSPNRVGHEHWSERAKATKAYRAEARLASMTCRPDDWAPTPVEISATFFCGLTQAEKNVRVSNKISKLRRPSPVGRYRPLDTMNAIASLKAAIDGLVDAGVIPNDTHKWVTWGKVVILRTKDQHFGQSGVLLEVSPVQVTA